MEFAEGYLTALQHISRLYEVEDDWSWTTVASLASAAATFGMALLMSKGNRAAGRAASAAEQSAADSRSAQILSHQSYTATQRAALRREMAEPDNLQGQLQDRFQSERATLSHLTMKTQEHLPAEMAHALREMSWLALSGISSELFKELTKAQIAWEAESSQHRDLSTPHELDETHKALHQHIVRIRRAHSAAALRLLRLKNRLECFDPADPANTARPLPEYLH